MIQNLIKEHVKVKASALVPHPRNFRKHPDEQRQALFASYEEIGFARSLLGYRLPDGRIQLIDGHLRAEATPAELTAHCRERLADFKVPKVFHVVPELPKGPTGKVQRRFMAAALLPGSSPAGAPG